jgi:double-strand break repair protein MRE11
MPGLTIILNFLFCTHSGIKKTSVIDHLAAASLLNHFGTCTDLNGFEIRPVLFRKGKTLLAIYGLGAMKDQRLYRLMREDKVNR